MAYLTVPSRFLIRTGGDAHSETDGSINLASSIFPSNFSSSSAKLVGVLVTAVWWVQLNRCRWNVQLHWTPLCPDHFLRIPWHVVSISLSTVTAGFRLDYLQPDSPSCLFWHHNRPLYFEVSLPALFLLLTLGLQRLGLLQHFSAGCRNFLLG